MIVISRHEVGMSKMCSLIQGEFSMQYSVVEQHYDIIKPHGQQCISVPLWLFGDLM